MTVSDQRRRNVRLPWASIVWSLTAAALFFGSAALQIAASLQRWVTFRASPQPSVFWAEDHVFDYSFPYDSPPYASQPAILWEPIGTAAQVFGIGMLIQALGVLAMAFGVLALPGRVARRRMLVEVVLALAVATSFGLTGTHALLSGIAGTPSPLQHFGLAAEILMVVGLIALAALWRSRSIAATVACVFLLGSSMLGYLVANMAIAPIFAGYGSHDTTPWMETVIGASTALAGLAMLAAIWMVARRGDGTRTPSPTPSLPSAADVSDQSD